MRLIREGGWVSKKLPGSRSITVSGNYGTVNVFAIGKNDYEALYDSIPSGAIIFKLSTAGIIQLAQVATVMGIVEDSRLEYVDTEMMPGTIYGAETRDIVICVPSGCSGGTIADPGKSTTKDEDTTTKDDKAYGPCSKESKEHVNQLKPGDVLMGTLNLIIAQTMQVMIYNVVLNHQLVQLQAVHVQSTV